MVYEVKNSKVLLPTDEYTTYPLKRQIYKAVNEYWEVEHRFSFEYMFYIIWGGEVSAVTVEGYCLKKKIKIEILFF